MIIESAFTKTMFHGTSSRFLRSILKEGLVQKGERVWKEGRLASLEGIYLTAKLTHALKAAHDAVNRFGGDRLIVVCKISIQHQPIDEDFVSDSLLSFDNPRHTLCSIVLGDFNLKEFIKNKLKVLSSFFSRPVLEAFLSNRRLFASLIVKYLAYEFTSKFEEKKKKGEYYDFYCRRGYLSFLFLKDKDGKLVRDENDYPILKRSSKEWYKLYREDLDKVTRLIGKYVSHISDELFLSIRVPKIGFRGSNRIIGIFREVVDNGRIFKPIYLAKGFDSHLRDFVNQLVLLQHGELPSERKEAFRLELNKLISDKLGYKFRS